MTEYGFDAYDENTSRNVPPVRLVPKANNLVSLEQRNVPRYAKKSVRCTIIRNIYVTMRENTVCYAYFKFSMMKRALHYQPVASNFLDFAFQI